VEKRSRGDLELAHGFVQPAARQGGAAPPPVCLRQHAGHDAAQVLALLKETAGGRVADEHGRAHEQHGHVQPEAIAGGGPVTRPAGHHGHVPGRPGGLGHHDGGLHRDRMAALRGLLAAEQLVHDEDRDQEH